MQEFLTNNTVSCNLMSLTGYRTLVILCALMESPKSNEEIKNCLLSDQYIKEKFSSDTLRIYINSLRKIGCEITKANKSNNKKYELTEHPFAYDISKPQLKALSKIYKNFHEKISVEEVISIENLFTKLVNFTKNETTKDFLRHISLLKSINKELLKDLLSHCKKKNQITLLYNSPKSGAKEIEIVADKLSFKSEKLYLWGNNLTHKEYAFLSVEKILKIISIKLKKDYEEFPSTKVVYEVDNQNNNFQVEPNETILEATQDKLIIEVNSKNEFSLIQRLLYLGDSCKIISPESFKSNFLSKLKAMEAAYENI